MFYELSIFISLGSAFFCFYLLNRIMKLEHKLKKREDQEEQEQQKQEGYEAKQKIEKEKKQTQQSQQVNFTDQQHKKEVTKKQKASGPTAMDAFLNWATTDWPMKLGALLLLIGFGWLTGYAFINDWIGPIGRITMGLIGGVLILLLGSWRIKKFKGQGGVLLGLGSSTILLTIFAAREIYSFFTPTTALALMSLVVVYIAVSSVKNKSKALAIMGIALGGIAPMLTNAADPSMIGLFSYLFLLSGGILWVVGITGWRLLTPIASGLVFLYALPYMTQGVEQVVAALIFAFMFTILFYLANVAAISYTKKSTVSDLIAAGINGVFILSWIGSTAPMEWKSLLAAAITLVFILGAFVIYKASRLKEPMYVYSGLSIVFLGAATAFELSGPALTIALTLEAGIISFIGAYLLKDLQLGQRLSGLLIIPSILSLESVFAESWNQGVIHDDFFVLFTLTITYLALGTYFYVRKSIENKEEGRTTSLFWVFGIYSITLIWLSFHAAIENTDIATMLSLVIYTIAGMAVYLTGKVQEKKDFLFAGGTVLGLVVARLLFIDIWEMDIVGKIITFFLIGALFISTAFIGNKSKDAN